MSNFFYFYIVGLGGGQCCQIPFLLRLPLLGLILIRDGFKKKFDIDLGPNNDSSDLIKILDTLQHEPFQIKLML